MRAFIVRPFGTKRGMDFDHVGETLIGAALTQCGIEGRTTSEIMSPGNIRESMFELLLTADIVIADVTLHNANVYYELGIRHALRDRITVLLRGVGGELAELAPDAVPFDLLTDRYVAYPIGNPAEALGKLVAAISQGSASSASDSPVFKLLPKLRAPSPDDFLAVPVGFKECADRAIDRASKYAGTDTRDLYWGDLALLAREARSFPWARAGLRLIGRKQFDHKRHVGARATWEAILRNDESDLEANLKLSTIYQKLGNYNASNDAVERIRARTDLAPKLRAEEQALLGSNLKVQWLESLKASPPESTLESALFADSLKAYEEGFRADRNHYYSAINALALTVIRRELAERYPQQWELGQPDDDTFEPGEMASRELNRVKERIECLKAGVALALESADEFEAEQNAVWRAFTAADLRCLVSSDPRKVGLGYRQVIEKYRDAFPFAIDSARAQLNLLQTVGVLNDNVAAGLAAFPPVVKAQAGAPASARGRIVLFAGHCVDSSGRQNPRFPRTPEAKQAAAQAIDTRLQRVRARPGGVALGMASGRSGGDILFHEACKASGIATWLYLARPSAYFTNVAVNPADDDWASRFYTLLDERGEACRVLQDLDPDADPQAGLPKWFAQQPPYDVWHRNSAWMLFNALAFGPDRVTMILLWDKDPAGDDSGVTKRLVDLAEEIGVEVDVIDSKTVFGLA
ncbi:tetratricopeptide repeat-containing protein [Caballeronia telluris]|uniref:DUF4071 domain-containing protein n=1 Tax=Caballeronia telluris TaxID=326475 RepID=A0A158ETU0_9BURK|nr:tetratricopeptide repeat-containing protein [Caballeronia telluris]SAL10893.1 hypothetical protein AWB66_00242 [Caballeronia telluris]